MNANFMKFQPVFKQKLIVHLLIEQREENYIWLSKIIKGVRHTY